MTVSKGLRELKLLDKRITKGTEIGSDTALFVSAVRGTDDAVAHGMVSTEDAEKEFKANLQSARDLILRRGQIKSAIVNSNAKTPVVIAGKKMSVAAAIERKNSIKYDKMLLTALQKSLSNISEWMDNQNIAVEKELAKILASNADSESEDLQAGIQAVIKAHRAENEVRLFDPINIREIIKEMDLEIDTFEAEVDLALTESNARTEIQIQ